MHAPVMPTRTSGAEIDDLVSARLVQSVRADYGLSAPTTHIEKYCEPPPYA